MSFQSTRGHHLRSALDTVQCFFPKIFRSYQRSRSLARIAALPTEAFLAQADRYDAAAQFCDADPSGNPLAVLFRDLADRWRCRAPSRQIAHERGAA
ncbi:Putative phage protein [Gluconobacter oxydans 621H]|uniref:Putative phage protein n=1 Tax=Gluconobacter oxydans (strain 621H) TaxID=290633 RepID=Q5FNJ0_GLUOX|nr:hypothetical protein [Gluconobacter oxydans]AAW62057.1 Putative phage protein [Gluconobacter oxydans 621H]